LAKIKAAIDQYEPNPQLADDRGATNERRQRANGNVFRDDIGRDHVRDSPINLALSRKQISGRQFTTATKLYNHWFRGGLVENFGSMDPNRIFGGQGSGAGMARTEAQAFHRQQYRKAVDIIGKKGEWILGRVVCREVSFADAGAEMGWKDRKYAVGAAIQSARNALDLLADEWGIGE
jgi:hypothetical protein